MEQYIQENEIESDDHNGVRRVDAVWTSFHKHQHQNRKKYLLLYLSTFQEKHTQQFHQVDPNDMLAISASFLAEISVKSPRFFFIFVI